MNCFLGKKNIIAQLKIKPKRNRLYFNKLWASITRMNTVSGF